MTAHNTPFLAHLHYSISSKLTLARPNSNLPTKLPRILNITSIAEQPQIIKHIITKLPRLEVLPIHTPRLPHKDELRIIILSIASRLVQIPIHHLQEPIRLAVQEDIENRVFAALAGDSPVVFADAVEVVACALWVAGFADTVVVAVVPHVDGQLALGAFVCGAVVVEERGVEVDAGGGRVEEQGEEERDHSGCEGAHFEVDRSK